MTKIVQANISHAINAIGPKIHPKKSWLVFSLMISSPVFVKLFLDVKSLRTIPINTSMVQFGNNLSLEPHRVTDSFND